MGYRGKITKIMTVSIFTFGPDCNDWTLIKNTWKCPTGQWISFYNVWFLAYASHILYQHTVFRVCVCIAKREGGEFKGRGMGPGQHCGNPFKKGLIRKGIREVYLHQLSARLLGWRRSCDPPAIVLELPAGNNHIVIAGAVLTSSTGDQRTKITHYSLQERFRARIWTENYGVETVIRQREENGHFYENRLAKMDMGKWLGLSNSGVCALYVRSTFVTEEFCGLHLVF